MDPNAVGILRGLVNIPWIDVAFLIDAGGRLLASAGSSPSFSPNGAFLDGPPETAVKPDSSLYMTAVTPGVYLGVIFPADVPIDDVRAEVKRTEGHLATAVSQG